MIVVVAAIVVAVAAANPSGIEAASAVDEVTKLDAMMPDLLAGNAKLKAVLANEKELRADLIAWGMVASDAERAAKQALKEQLPEAGQPKTFIAVEAVVEPSGDGGPHNVVLFDGGHKVAKVQLHARGPHTFALFSAPYVKDGDVAAYAKELFSSAASTAQISKLTGKAYGGPTPATVQHFVKKGAAWESAPPLVEPPPAKLTCADRMSSLAKSLYVAEESYRAEKDVYSTKLTDIGLDVEKDAKVTIKSATATAFLAEVALAGGVVTIDDKRAIAVVKPCKDAP